MAAGKQQRGLMDCPLLPGLPTDLAMLCLAKLPIDAAARCRSVSRAFASALCHYAPLGRLPQSLAALCTGNEEDNSMTWIFLSLHPDLRSLVVPIFFLKGRNDEACRSTFRLQEPQIGIVEDEGPGCLQGFDVWQMKWLNPRATPWGPMPVDRWDFATARIGKHVYFAGGKSPWAAASGAERLSLDTWTWETLPPMHRERSFQPSAFAIGGRLVVVGGESDSVPCRCALSGEVYDPTTNAWTFVPDMWPSDLWWSFGGWSFDGPQLVTVIKDVAYAIDHKLQVIVQLKMDSPSFTNVKWHKVGQLPMPLGLKGFTHEAPRLLSVQDELWAVLTFRTIRDYRNVRLLKVFSCKPHLDNGRLHWERLCNIAPSWTMGMDVST